LFPISAGACWQAGGGLGGKLMVLGSASIFADQWLDKEDNSRFMDFVFKWLKPVSGLGGGTASIVACLQILENSAIIEFLDVMGERVLHGLLMHLRPKPPHVVMYEVSFSFVCIGLVVFPK
jgi:hypothetical protein